MKKIVFSIFLIMAFLIISPQVLYAKDIEDMTIPESIIIAKNTTKTKTTASSTEGASSSEGGTSSDFVQRAFDATSDFLSETPQDPQGSNGTITQIFEFLKKLIKAINRVLLVALSALSMIALAVVGIKYIMSGSNAGSQMQAKEELKTVIIGMAFGYGAYAIWAIGMSLVSVIINTLKG